MFAPPTRKKGSRHSDVDSDDGKPTRAEPRNYGQRR
eukprot:COSAG05_NODE_13206_length_438_cov_0.917404_1_plen_35_part_01